ncbi:MAG: inositol-3-phosphate synthase [Deltaproteobacteria bacterium]|nr:inositol-3-phosphate synthase [Deltaproteobacteria bacterium]
MAHEIRVAIAGIGNCASSLIQGIEYYKNNDLETSGLAFDTVGPYSPKDIIPVSAFDIDQRKVGKPLHKAIFEKPNCTTVFQKELPDYGVTVHMSPVLDGFSKHLEEYEEHERFVLSEEKPCNVVSELQKTKADLLICYLPVGSEEAVKFYANACLEAGVAFINCIPVFIASHPEYASAFKEKNIPLVGDDIKSQFGATILHRVIAKTLSDRGLKVERTYQLNTGGNTDFLNMLERSRLKSKKKSKTQSVQSQLKKELATENIHIGPSDYIPWQKDNKVAFIRVEGKGFGNVPFNLEARLSVEDSPNSAGVVIDAIRFTKLALDKKIGGVLYDVSSYCMKSPPQQKPDASTREALEKFLSIG